MIYRRAKYLALKPPLAHGGHTFDCLDPIGEYQGPPLLRCIDCHLIVPNWQLQEGFAGSCRGLLAAISKRPPRKW